VTKLPVVGRRTGDGGLCRYGGKDGCMGEGASLSLKGTGRSRLGMGFEVEVVEMLKLFQVEVRVRVLVDGGLEVVVWKERPKCCTSGRTYVTEVS
jgi:hypothetical protein